MLSLYVFDVPLPAVPQVLDVIVLPMMSFPDDHPGPNLIPAALAGSTFSLTLPVPPPPSRSNAPTETPRPSCHPILSVCSPCSSSLVDRSGEGEGEGSRGRHDPVSSARRIGPGALRRSRNPHRSRTAETGGPAGVSGGSASARLSPARPIAGDVLAGCRRRTREGLTQSRHLLPSARARRRCHRQSW